METDQLPLKVQENIVEHRIPILEPQAEIWLACMLGGESANKSYNISFYEYLEGELNEEALKDALQELINRHQSLRATFTEDGTEMVVYRERKLDYKFNNISAALPSEKEAFLNRMVNEHADSTFDLLNGPLFKTSLTKLDEKKYHLSINFHHIICDGYSSGILMKELCHLYNGKVLGRKEELQPPVEFSSYAQSKHQSLHSPDYQESERFWINQFKDNVPMLNIPPDFTRPSARSYSGARVSYRVDDTLSKKYKRVGFQHGCSSAISLRAALEIFLHLVSGQKKIVTGLPVAGQLTEEDFNLVGHCVNLLPLKTEIDDNLDFLQYLKHRRDYVLEAFGHHQLTFSTLLNKLNLLRDPSRVPMVPVVLNIQSEPYENHFHELKSQSSFNIKKYETFEITINVDDLPSGMTFRWDYNTSLFTADTIQFFHKQFEYIMGQIAEEPTVMIRDIRLLEHSRKCLTLFEPLKTTLYDLLRDSFARHRHHSALSFKGQHLSYEDLDKQSNQFARVLHSHGVKEGDRIAISIGRSIELIVAITGIIKAGAAYLPLDRTFPTERISQIIENSGLACIISDETSFNTSRGEATVLDVKSLLTRSGDFSELPLPMSYASDNIVYVLHTSGSTGQPKGVCMHQHALTNLLLWQKKNSSAKQGTRTLQFTPITFDVSFQEIFSTLISGGELHLITDEQRIDGLFLLEHIKTQGIERLFLPFVALQSLAENAVATNTFPTKLTEVITAGEQLKITPNIEQFFAELPESILYNQYGPTEAHVVTQLELSGPSSLWPKLPSIGTPITNCEILILDEHLRQVYPGVPGELFISGTPLSPGYLNLEEITKQKFISWRDGNGQTKRIYRTGDSARLLPDGNIEYLDRVDHQVKIRGYRIELMEVELQVSRLSDVSLAACRVQTDSEGNTRLIAYFVPDQRDFEPGEDTHEEWKTVLKKQLPEYMIPFAFVQMEQMPMTSTGKIDRKALPEVKEFKRPSKKKSAPPRTAAEKFLVETWCKALGLVDVSIDENFFELGGHSLLAVKVVSAIQRKKGIKLPLSALFENSTIESLARILEDGGDKVKWDSLVPIKTSGNMHPIYLVHGGGLHIMNFKPLENYMDSKQPIYAMQALGLNGETELLYSMEELAQRYIEEILQNDPVGPYSLGGYSFGGLLAFEMAKQLIAQGKEVRSLAILDTYAGGKAANETKARKIRKKITRQFFKGLFIARQAVKSPKKTVQYQKAVLTGKIKSLLKSGYEVQENFFTYNPEINRSYDIAYEKYLLEPINVKVDLFKTKERLHFLDDGEFYGWKPFALKGVQVYEVPGDHRTFLMEPNIKHFATLLQQSLNKA